jgi:hypothetical protein
MRANSTLAAGLAPTLTLSLTLLASAVVPAHQRDEYLQAARIALRPHVVDVDLDLTPGIAVAESFISTIDSDRDGAISAQEERRYANEVMRDLVIALDGRPLQMQLISSTFPDLDAVRRGEGTLRLRARATLPSASTGSHRLLFKNLHLPDHSAYLANTLAPENTRISVTAQRRIGDQSELTIEYDVHADPAVVRAALGISLAVAAVLIVPTVRRFRAA